MQMCVLYSIIGNQSDIIYDLLVNIRGQQVSSCPAATQAQVLQACCKSGRLQDLRQAGLHRQRTCSGRGAHACQLLQLAPAPSTCASVPLLSA